MKAIFKNKLECTNIEFIGLHRLYNTTYVDYNFTDIEINICLEVETSINKEGIFNYTELSKYIEVKATLRIKDFDELSVGSTIAFNVNINNVRFYNDDIINEIRVIYTVREWFIFID